MTSFMFEPPQKAFGSITICPPTENRTTRINMELQTTQMTTNLTGAPCLQVGSKGRESARVPRRRHARRLQGRTQGLPQDSEARHNRSWSSTGGASITSEKLRIPPLSIGMPANAIAGPSSTTAASNFSAYSRVGSTSFLRPGVHRWRHEANSAGTASLYLVSDTIEGKPTEFLTALRKLEDVPLGKNCGIEWVCDRVAWSTDFHRITPGTDNEYSST